MPRKTTGGSTARPRTTAKATTVRVSAVGLESMHRAIQTSLLLALLDMRCGLAAPCLKCVAQAAALQRHVETHVLAAEITTSTSRKRASKRSAASSGRARSASASSRSRRRFCGWGADHEAHAHPGMENTRCPGKSSR